MMCWLLFVSSSFSCFGRCFFLPWDFYRLTSSFFAVIISVWESLNGILVFFTGAFADHPEIDLVSPSNMAVSPAGWTWTAIQRIGNCDPTNFNSWGYMKLSSRLHKGINLSRILYHTPKSKASKTIGSFRARNYGRWNRPFMMLNYILGSKWNSRLNHISQYCATVFHVCCFPDLLIFFKSCS